MCAGAVTPRRFEAAPLVWGRPPRARRRPSSVHPPIASGSAPAARQSWAIASPLATYLNLDAGASLRDLQDAMGHASPRTTRRYGRSRSNLDRSPGYLLAGYISRDP